MPFNDRDTKKVNKWTKRQKHFNKASYSKYKDHGGDNTEEHQKHRQRRISEDEDDNSERHLSVEGHYREKHEAHIVRMRHKHIRLNAVRYEFNHKIALQKEAARLAIEELERQFSEAMKLAEQESMDANFPEDISNMIKLHKYSGEGGKRAV